MMWGPHGTLSALGPATAPIGGLRRRAAFRRWEMDLKRDPRGLASRSKLFQALLTFGTALAILPVTARSDCMCQNRQTRQPSFSQAPPVQPIARHWCRVPSQCGPLDTFMHPICMPRRGNQLMTIHHYLPHTQPYGYL